MDWLQRKLKKNSKPCPDELTTTLSTPEFIKSESTKAFTTVGKDITKELTAMERLGGVRDLMARCFKIEGEDFGGPKVQEPKFRWVKSGWQMPM